VGGLEFGISDIRGLGVGIESTLRDLLVDFSHCVFRNISIVVTLHFKIEDFGFRTGGLLNKVLIE